MKNIGVMFSTFDGDAKHFDRFIAELERLAFPFAAHLDHCCAETKKRFAMHPLCVGVHMDDDPESHWDESFRQSALSILQEREFKWALSLDTDETLERKAPEKIVEATKLGADIVDFRVLDLWGDGRHYRKDGPFEESHREKLFNLRAGDIAYYHPTIHAPKVKPHGREVVVAKYYPIYVLHWGIMDMDDVRLHTARFDAIYNRKVGGNPYTFYKDINDPATVPIIKEVPEELL